MQAAVDKTVATLRRHRHLRQQRQRHLSCTGTLADRHEALRPDASDQHARHVPRVRNGHPASEEGRQPAHPDAVAAARHEGEMVRAARRLHDGEVRHEHVRARAGRRVARQGHRRQRAVAAHRHRHRGGPEPARRRRHDAARRASRRSWPTRPTRSSTSRRAKFTGNFLIDDTFLAENGVTDFDQYRVDPTQKLAPDFFVPESMAPPKGVSFEAVSAAAR